MPDTILVSEVFGPVIQGEGALAGKISHFVRTAGCAYRCIWCDSMHAVDPVKIHEKATHLTSDDILLGLSALPRAPWVTLSGGDPVAWDLAELCGELRLRGYRIAVETQGALWRDWLQFTNLVTCSPKPPSSGMADRLDIPMLQKYVVRLGDRLVFKIVAFDGPDLDFVERIHKAFPKVPMYVSTGTAQGGDNLRDIQQQVIDRFRIISTMVMWRSALNDVTVGCQQHVLMYGHELKR